MADVAASDVADGPPAGTPTVPPAHPGTGLGGPEAPTVPEPGSAARWTLSASDADHLELILAGGYPQGPRYSTAGAAVGELLDGPAAPADRPLALRVPTGTVVAGQALVLLDPEHVPVAVLDVAEVDPHGAAHELLTGALRPLQRRSPGPFAALRADTRIADGTSSCVVVPTDRPLLPHAVEAAVAAAGSGSVLLLALTGAGRPAPVPLLRALLVVADGIPRVDVARVPLPTLPGLTTAQQMRLLSEVARRHGGTEMLLPSTPGENPEQLAAGLAQPLALPVRQPGPGPLAPEVLEDLLDRGAALPSGVVSARLEAALSRAHPPRTARGLVVLMTGLSGSGKSTVAAELVTLLAETSDRDVTLLDGDLVRTLLSAGLTFSRGDRDLNVRRIGWVAAEVARHGGTAVCAPIAPYAAVRAEVRSMVEQAGGVLLLVHVSTPLEVCEARDRKGLYARARSGELPHFTGVSDPYEVPQDADVRVDTSQGTARDSALVVLDEIRRRGLVASPDQED